MILCPPEEIPEIVANATGVDGDFMRYAFESLDRVGMIDKRPFAGAAGNAAKLVVAALSCDSPFVADHLVGIYANLPAVKFAGFDKRLILDPQRHLQPAEDVPVLPGAGQGWNALTRNFVSAVAALIRDAVRHFDLRADVLPQSLSARHSARAPLAAIKFPSHKDNRVKQIWFELPTDRAQSDFEIRERLVTISKIPGVALGRLASALNPVPPDGDDSDHTLANSALRPARRTARR